MTTDCGAIISNAHFSHLFVLQYPEGRPIMEVQYCKFYFLLQTGQYFVLRSSRPKVISPEVVSPETRVMSPEIYSHVAQYFESCRPK